MTSKSFLSSVLALVLIFGITVSDVGRMFFELEDGIERRELEEEELREGAEGQKNWLFDSCDDGALAARSSWFPTRSRYSILFKCFAANPVGSRRPLYLLHCSRKIPQA